MSTSLSWSPISCDCKQNKNDGFTLLGCLSIHKNLIQHSYAASARSQQKTVVVFRFVDLEERIS